jgi:5-methyltetrahydrofolate--homocysteine methyltransferase
MKTVVRSDKKVVTIDTEGALVIIGEKINPTGRKKMAEALQAGNLDYVRNLALEQVKTGAEVLDVNVGVAGMDDVALMPEIVKMVASCVDVPLCLYSPNTKTLEAGLKEAPGKVLVNSVSGREPVNANPAVGERIWHRCHRTLDG